MDPKLTSFCALTCVNGIEKPACPCPNSENCELRDLPGFDEARLTSKEKMLRWLKTELQKYQQELRELDRKG